VNVVNVVSAVPVASVCDNVTAVIQIRQMFSEDLKKRWTLNSGYSGNVFIIGRKNSKLNKNVRSDSQLYMYVHENLLHFATKATAQLQAKGITIN